MAKGIREFNQKLASMRNSLKMTKTMKMVSASKLRRAQDNQRKSKAYAEQVSEIIGRLAASVDPEAHVLLTPRENPKKVLVLLFTSDKGLCGAFNNAMIRQTELWVAEKKKTYETVDLSFCGRRGFAYFNQRLKVSSYYEGVTAEPQFSNASLIAGELIDGFTSGEYDEVYVASNEFVSPLKQVPTFQKLLPMEAEEFCTDVPERSREYIFEPEQDQLLDALIPKIVRFKLYYTLLENAAGEHGARMTAMDNATTNCTKLIDHYTLMRNRARQAAITTELIEIISGAEAL